MVKTNNGFTLIELLIVVAIIAILAAIAIPNFLAAQTRSKVSTNRADFRTLATALESYYVDNNCYPMEWQFDTYKGGGPWHIDNVITTPIAYITRQPKDPFVAARGLSTWPIDGLAGYYAYTNWGFRVLVGYNLTNSRYGLQIYGPWKLYGCGPDGNLDWSILYDPTNGTISNGDILRTAFETDGNPRY